MSEFIGDGETTPIVLLNRDLVRVIEEGNGIPILKAIVAVLEIEDEIIDENGHPDR